MPDFEYSGIPRPKNDHGQSEVGSTASASRQRQAQSKRDEVLLPTLSYVSMDWHCRILDPVVRASDVD